MRLLQDWLVIEEEDVEEKKCEESVDDISITKRSAAFSPDLANESLLRHRRRIGTMRRSSSNPNLLSCAMDLDSDTVNSPLPRVTSPDPVTRQRCSRPRSQSLVAFNLANKPSSTASSTQAQVINEHSTSPESDENLHTKSGSFIHVFAKKKHKEKKLTNEKKSNGNLARSNSDVGTPNGSATRTPKPPMSPKIPAKGIWKKAKNYIGGLNSNRKAGPYDGEQENKPIPEEDVSENNTVVKHLDYSSAEDVEWKSVERKPPDGWNQRGYLLMAEKPTGGSTKYQWNNVVCIN